ncbi:hypothetical protein BGZ50_006220 [Haplosporangium sp. Z 11]|nr:hypothetical protein BGZ50_006220 [Haplosporangium sp. Z 11]
MSRRDIAVILEKLSLDHRTSLSEKACAFLQAVESNGSIKNHISHAAICVEIAATQLDIQISRPALVRLSGASSPLMYSSTFQTLSRFLTGKTTDAASVEPSGAAQETLSAESRHGELRLLLSSTSTTYLRQLAIQYGSMELDGLVLECLERFFGVWVKSLAPAQRMHVNYSDAKWVGAAFWLCAMARNMVLTKDVDSDKIQTQGQDKASSIAGGTKTATPKSQPKKIGGRRGKELKDIILQAVEHKVKKSELDNTIRLIEGITLEYLLSLRKPREGASTSSRPRIRSVTGSNDAGLDTTEDAKTANGSTRAPRRGEGLKSGPVDAYAGLGTKRQISNVSQLSFASDTEIQEGDYSETASSAVSSRPEAKVPPAKRSKLDPQISIGMTSTDIMGIKRSTARKGLKETAAASQNASQMLSRRRKTGGIYSMISRVKYEHTRSYLQYQEWRTRILKRLDKTLTIPLERLDKAKSRFRLAQILFEETESSDRTEEEVNKAIIIADAIQGSSALDIQLQLYDLQIQIFIESKRFRLAKNTLRIASSEATKHGLSAWTYQFVLLKARVYFLMDDIAGSLAILNQGASIAEQQGDFDLKARHYIIYHRIWHMAFWIVAAQYSLMLSRWDEAVFYLERLKPHMGIMDILDRTPSPVQQSTTPSSTPQPARSQQPQVSCQSKQLRVFFLILYISCMLRLGRMEKAQAALTALHTALDETRPKDLEELQGVFRVLLKNKVDNVLHYQHQHIPTQHGPCPYIAIKWMSFSQVYCLTYLLSGICSKSDMTQPLKSQQFLIEGIKVVDNETSTIYVRRNQRWFSLLMMTMLLHLSDVYLIKFDLVSAEEALLKATYWSKVCGVWETFKERIALSVGMTMHLGGRIDEALEWYGICMGHVKGSRQDPEGYGAKSLAIINTAFIYCGERYFDLQRTKELLAEAKARHAAAPSVNMVCALHILDSWTKEGLIPARQHLQEALKISSALLNTQMRSLTLLLLGNVYLQTHDEQAEKMLRAGYTEASKTNLYLKNGQGIKASNQAKDNKPVLEDIDHTFQLSLMAPLLHVPNAAEHEK